MTEVRRNTIVGVFMVVGLVALGWLLSSFGELPAFMGRGEYELTINVKEAGGIGEGAAIFLSGMQIGRVKELRFKDPEHLDAGVQIIGGIMKQYTIPRTAVAEIQPGGLGLSRGQININVPGGEAQPLPLGQEIPGIMGNVWGDMIPNTLLDSIDRSVAQFGNFVEALTPVADDLHLLLEQHPVEEVDNPIDRARQLTANISTLIERSDKMLKTFNEMFGDPKMKEGLLEMFANVKKMSSDGREALENINAMTADLQVDVKRISAKLEGGIDNANVHIGDIADSLRPMLENTAKLAASLLRLSMAIERGEGTAGRVMTDARLYESLLLTANRLTGLIDRIDRIFAKFERDGAIGIKVPSPIGPIPRSFNIPDSAR
ncbi:MAG: MlaD family protein [Phycisphaerae bacterium]